ncbi:MAG: hypothetical protein UV71_C0007G0015 [Microgenomates group bacterium GW2011_GWC1_43_13]|uniref:Uncharacterized protein n=2 Tax=Candidatus Woeseibacteriota TaxID=1752722 RepID=A0A837I9A5_9BACT|nr:MAG: hypothetical protein UV71_C0007G0015 [Microgenomates group bacterium GW2011_GWC1_43_13]KKT32647.1 MAG: hypothetical protein UW20_C0011G0017 [Candidatus Woesebacteria bacterium GW2011_GWB1_44_11]KKT54219.1 MAG: hypothetical protein UW47_C0008G0018 [Candidatus Woesebacteria bacterium GW2011_GWA1_44_23]OGM76782.1 MAG: hypothetical protein A2208_02385 [Candidatus Woesebacteria bacterium RIFOXYA1_FULL_43_16]OGM82339.1 MAG: hypothetical protein A2394_01945 [Candidatus Woesebacteria bacterium 
MHEKPSEAQYSECSFMANYGVRCGKDVGCRVQKFKKGHFLNKLPSDRKVEIKSQIEQAAALSGCPNFAGKPHPESDDRMGHEGS